MLQKAAHFITALSTEQAQRQEEKAMLKREIDNLKQTITAYQCQLPASGGPINQGSSQAREMLQGYIRARTLDNWKFWIFSQLIQPMFESYNGTVSTNNLEEALRTIINWLERNCSLVSLRKDLLNSLTFLSTNTSMLNAPQILPTEAVNAVRYHEDGSNNLSNSATATVVTTSSSVIKAITTNTSTSMSQQQSQGVNSVMPAEQLARNVW